MKLSGNLCICWCRNIKQKRSIVLSVLVFMGAVGLLSYSQFRNPDLIDPDSFYHVGVAQSYWVDGLGALSAGFPWTRFGLWADAYSDKEFLFHVLMSPFAATSGINGAKAFAVLLGALVFVTFHVVCKRLGVISPTLWTALFFCGSFGFVFRLQQCRPHLLNITVMLMSILALKKRSVVAITALSAFSSLSYSIPLAIPGLVGAFCVADGVLRRRWNWRLIFGAIVGLVVGTVVHPHFPNNIVGYRFLLATLLNILASREAELQMGSELFAPPGRTVLVDCHVPLLVLTSVILGFIFRRREGDPVWVGIWCCGIVLVILTLWSWRFVELMVPVVLLSGSWYWKDVRIPLVWPKWQRGALGLILILVFVVAMGRRADKIGHAVKSSQFPMFSDVGAWLEKYLTDGQNVFTEGWSEFCELFFYCRKGRYIIGLAPSYLFNYDARRFQLWYDIGSLKVNDVEAAIRDEFGSMIVITSNGSPLWSYLRGSLKATLKFNGKKASVYVLNQGQSIYPHNWQVVEPRGVMLEVTTSGLVRLEVPASPDSQRIVCQTRLEATRLPVHGRVFFSISPSGSVFLDGEELGDDRFFSRLVPGERWIRVSLTAPSCVLEVRIPLEQRETKSPFGFFCRWESDDERHKRTTPGGMGRLSGTREK